MWKILDLETCEYLKETNRSLHFVFSKSDMKYLMGEQMYNLFLADIQQVERYLKKYLEWLSGVKSNLKLDYLPQKLETELFELFLEHVHLKWYLKRWDDCMEIKSNATDILFPSFNKANLFLHNSELQTQQITYESFLPYTRQLDINKPLSEEVVIFPKRYMLTAVEV